MKALLPCIALLGLATAASASDLDISVQSGGSNSVIANAGATVSYEIVAELGDNANQGLGLILFDLEFEGGDLTQADEPAASPMTNFANPLGFGPGMTNPAGFGGTVDDGNLLQVGGAQNTIGNTFSPAPSGAVSLGVGAQGAPQVVATGTLTAPTAPGTYSLRVTDLIANVIKQGETGSPFWAVERAGVGNVTDLTVVVASGCQESLGFAGPGNIAVSICGDDLQSSNSDAVFSLTGATPNTVAYILVGLQSNPTAVEGGILVPVPVLFVVDNLSTDGAGSMTFPVRGGPSTPSTIYMQAVVPNGPVFEFSNALKVNIGK